MTLLMAIDIESIGLHGEGFAVGYVLTDMHGIELEAGRFACAPAAARGSDDDRLWVSQNVPTRIATHATPREMRTAFWQRWLHWTVRGATMLANCAWPVEARFLAACVDDNGPTAHWQGPYPLLDVSSLAVALGLDPRAAVERLPNELPLHDPLADARMCARLWREYSAQIAASGLARP